MNALCDDLKRLADKEWYGVRFVNIEINNHDKMIEIDHDERRMIKSLHKKQILYDLIDDEQKKVHDNNRLMRKFKRIIKNNRKSNEQSTKLDTRYNDLIQLDGELFTKKSNHINMNKRDLEKLSKSELIELFLKEKKKKPQIVIVDDRKTEKAMKGYTISNKINIRNNIDPLLQRQNTRKAAEYHLIKQLSHMKALKFVEILKVTFEKQTGHEEKAIKAAYFNSDPQTIINNEEILEALNLSKQQILNKIPQWISEGSNWTIKSIDNHYFNIAQIQTDKRLIIHQTTSRIEE